MVMCYYYIINYYKKLINLYIFTRGLHRRINNLRGSYISLPQSINYIGILINNIRVRLMFVTPDAEIISELFYPLFERSVHCVVFQRVCHGLYVYKWLVHRDYLNRNAQKKKKKKRHIGNVLISYFSCNGAFDKTLSL